jgi:hypothetical protein
MIIFQEDSTYPAQSHGKKARYLPRQNYAHFCALKMQPKLPFRLTVTALAKSSHHEDFANALTCRWFGDGFSDLIAQKWPFWLIRYQLSTK